MYISFTNIVIFQRFFTYSENLIFWCSIIQIFKFTDLIHSPWLFIHFDWLKFNHVFDIFCLIILWLCFLHSIITFWEKKETLFSYNNFCLIHFFHFFSVIYFRWHITCSIHFALAVLTYDLCFFSLIRTVRLSCCYSKLIMQVIEFPLYIFSSKWYQKA